ncbi:MAG TPA: radical SAM/SPASM domain-containing protein [Thermoanaerobaculia bacterium]|nr:radical SAM/SPASM domain-containing protein [Thermoanaerobaculia bacterium]
MAAIKPLEGTWTVSPYLHREGTAVYNPVTGARVEGLTDGDLRALADGHAAAVAAETRARVEEARFLIEDVLAESHRFSLFCVSLETSSVCNHRCDFCPVSVDPREAEVMPPALFERIVAEIAALATPRTVVFLNNYNEPTVDPFFEDRCRTLFARGLPVSLLTNASGLKPDVARSIASAGRFRYLGVNLPTLDPERYRALHGTRDLARVVAHVEALETIDVAEEKAIVALGREDDAHRADVEALRARFPGWDVRPFPIRSRAGQIGEVLPPPKKDLRGCELMGSRPFEHLHVNATGSAVLCCQDYYEKWPVGDLNRQSVAEVLGGEKIAQMRRWAYGVEDAPDDFLCRRCEFALGR